MLQVPPPLIDNRPQCPIPWQPGRALGLNCGSAVINGVVGGGGGCIRPDRSSRTNVQKLTWRNSNWVRGYHEDHVGSMTISDVSPTVAIKRIIILYENKQFREAANFINRLHRSTFKSILEDLPVDVFVEAVPESLPILESLYAKVFLSDGLNFPMKILRPETVIMQIANLFSQKDISDSFMPNTPNPDLLSCKKLIKMIVLSEPRLKKQMMGRRRALEKAVEGMGQHGLVGTSDKTLMNLHEALKLEFERIIHLYKTALQKLDDLSLAPKQLVTRSLSYGPAPIKASHQRQLSLRQDEIQERLIKNKTLLNVIEPTLTDHSLEVLLKILRKRVEIDKDIVFQFTQLKKEVRGVDPDSVVAPILMKFAKGCTKVLEIMKELGDDGDDDISSSDISGYHSDSDSAAASGSFQSRGCRRYNLMYRSVRVNSRNSCGGSSTDSRSTESARSSRNKQKIGSNRSLATVSENKFSAISIHVPDFRSLSSSEGSRISPAGSRISPAGSRISLDGSRISPDGSRISPDGSRISPDGSRISPDGSRISPDGSRISLDGSRTTDGSRSSSRATLVNDGFALQQEVENLKKDLRAAQLTISALHEREIKLKCRLAEQAQKMLERGSKFENLSLGDKRPTALLRRFGNLYAQSRVDTLDALDALLPLNHSDELKTKILFSVIVLAFRSVQNTATDIKLNLRTLLQVRDLSKDDPTLRELDNGVALYLRKTADSFDLSKNGKDVCAQIYATLYDYPCLKDCPALMSYVKDCVRIAWALSNQNPPYVIDYETRKFNPDIHIRFHCSDPVSDAIKNYMWPVLLEGENGPCVHKGVVLT